MYRPRRANPSGVSRRLKEFDDIFDEDFVDYRSDFFKKLETFVRDGVSREYDMKTEAAEHGIDPAEYWKYRSPGTEPLHEGVKRYNDVLTITKACYELAQDLAYQKEITATMGRRVSEDRLNSRRRDLWHFIENRPETLEAAGFRIRDGEIVDAYSHSENETARNPMSIDQLAVHWEREINGSGSENGTPLRERVTLSFEPKPFLFEGKLPTFNRDQKADGLQRLDWRLIDYMGINESFYQKAREIADITKVDYPKNPVIAMEYEAIKHGIEKEKLDKICAGEEGIEYDPTLYEYQQYAEPTAQRMLDMNVAIQNFVGLSVTQENMEQLLIASGEDPKAAHESTLKEIKDAYRAASDMYCSIPQDIRTKNPLILDEDRINGPEMPFRKTFFTMERILSESTKPPEERYEAQADRKVIQKDWPGHTPSAGPRPFEIILQKAEAIRQSDPNEDCLAYGYENDDGGPIGPLDSYDEGYW